jgi:DNA-binding beta-propeller fold protein YncE
MKKTVAVLVGLSVVIPASAQADGLPVVGLDARTGVVSPNGLYRYVTFVSGRNTVVARLHVSGAGVARYRTIRGQFMVPAVAYDNSTSGLSADGRTLVLIRPRTAIPQKRTQLVVLDARRLLVQRHVVLAGDFSFDAVSPDGSKLYLVNYLSLSRHNFNPTNYAVRSLNARTGKLDPKPVVDPREPHEKMGGLPVTRTTSPDGRWAYTLYSGSEHPFVHALDTVGNSARCVDLDSLTTRDDLFQMKLRVAAGGDQLQIVKAKDPVLIVNSHTFAVSRPQPAAPAPRANAPAQPGGGEARLWPFALAIAALVLLAAASFKPLARAARAR